MKRLSILLIALSLAACGGSPSDQPAADDAAEPDAASEAPADNTEAAAGQRPDPLDPAGENLTVPAGWEVRLDSPDPDVIISADTSTADIFFVNMTPGWHITTRQPRAIFWHPASTAEGNYTAMVKMHLFNPGPRRNEGYGMFVGGSNLQGPDQRYLYFLLRRSGDYLIKLRDGDDTETIVGWTAHDAIAAYDESTEGTAVNTLAVTTSDESIDFVVDDEIVHTLPRADLPTEGIVGLRVNHALNIHVEDFGVTEAM